MRRKSKREDENRGREEAVLNIVQSSEKINKENKARELLKTYVENQTHCM